MQYIATLAHVKEEVLETLLTHIIRNKAFVSTIAFTEGCQAGKEDKARVILFSQVRMFLSPGYKPSLVNRHL